MATFEVFISQFMRRTEQIEAETPREAANKFKELTGYCPDRVDDYEVSGFDESIGQTVFKKEGYFSSGAERILLHPASEFGRVKIPKREQKT